MAPSKIFIGKVEYRGHEGQSSLFSFGTVMALCYRLSRVWAVPCELRGTRQQGSHTKAANGRPERTVAHWSPKVANKFIRLAEEGEQFLTPLQVIKLVYIAHGFSLVRLGRALTRDKAEAWRYGPVYRALYSSLRDYKSGPILEEIPKFPPDDFLPDEEELIKNVYYTYCDLSGVQLSSMTHKQGTPWYVTWNHDGENATIPDELIREHYIELDRRPNRGQQVPGSNTSGADAL